MRILPVMTLALVSCSSGTEPRACAEEEEVFVFVDNDGDGFGVESLGYRCAVGDGQSLNALDCDDDDATKSPDAPELCDGLDNNCDGRIDEGLPNLAYFSDADGDGFGDPSTELTSCVDPGDGFVQNANDCDDSRGDRFPGNVEICNNGIDEDCTGIADDIPEVCDDGIDNNCNGLLDCNDTVECVNDAACLQDCANQALPQQTSLTVTGDFVGMTDDYVLNTGNCFFFGNGVDIALQFVPPQAGTYNISTTTDVAMGLFRLGCNDPLLDNCIDPFTGNGSFNATAQAGDVWIIVIDNVGKANSWTINIDLL